MIQRGVVGEYHQLGSTGIVQWQYSFDAWEVFVGELNIILQQISHGQGMSEFVVLSNKLLLKA
jgi:hypothetical protein